MMNTYVAAIVEIKRHDALTTIGSKNFERFVMKSIYGPDVIAVNCEKYYFLRCKNLLH